MTVVLSLFAAEVTQAGEKPDKKAGLVVPQYLLDAAARDPKKTFDVIVQGNLKGEKSDKLAKRLAKLMPGDGSWKTKREFVTISGVHLSLAGKDLLKLAKTDGILSITPDAVVRSSARKGNPQKWAAEIGATWFWNTPQADVQAGTIAIVDSGVEPDASLLGPRLLTQVDFVTAGPNTPGDGYGHGSFVAAIAAGEGSPYAGVAQTAKVVSLDVINDEGAARTSDVIAAADWIYQHRQAYNIKVANFSLHSAAEASFLYDPLNKAVQKLWFSGIFVVAAAGNYNVDGKPNGVKYAPGNDPFVMTVAALDVNGDTDPSNDFTAPWSAWGYTVDGFRKPDIGAPGRYMNGTVPSRAKLFQQRVTARVSPGLMQLSGTSFAAPAVAGAASVLMALHPEWSVDQVKGALMLTANQSSLANDGSSGVGVVSLKKAIELTVSPPVANAVVRQFVIPDPAGGPTPVFNVEAFKTTATANPDWNGAAYSSASWASASWASASWASASWASASWASASWASASWASASEADASHADNADGDGRGVG